MSMKPSGNPVLCTMYREHSGKQFRYIMWLNPPGKPVLYTMWLEHLGKPVLYTMWLEPSGKPVSYTMRQETFSYVNQTYKVSPIVWKIHIFKVFSLCIWLAGLCWYGKDFVQHHLTKQPENSNRKYCKNCSNFLFRTRFSPWPNSVWYWLVLDLFKTRQFWK